MLWGVASSAFQIEGDIENDMTAWERLGKFRANGKNPAYGRGSDHWQQWENDFLLLKKMGINAYRFSIEWARIQPEPDRFNLPALEQYERMIDRLLEYGITPMLTLHHFTHPQWFHKRSPWPVSESVNRFIEFASIIADRFTDRVSYWITLNEPLVWALAAYGDAQFPPGERNLNKMMQALRHMLTAHRQVYDLLKSKNAEALVGIAKNFIYFVAGRPWFMADQGIVQRVHTFYNLMIPQAFKTNRLKFRFPFMLDFDEPVELDDRIDFWGINYYYRMHARFRMNLLKPFELYFRHKSPEGQSEMGWENYSRGLREVFRWLRPTGKPMFVTENGIASEYDVQRIEYLSNHLHELKRAIRKGYPVQGYFHWSFLDNYEWLEGTSARFGLVHVDYKDDYQRRIKQSAEFYKSFILTSKIYTRTVNKL